MKCQTIIVFFFFFLNKIKIIIKETIPADFAQGVLMVEVLKIICSLSI